MQETTTKKVSVIVLENEYNKDLLVFKNEQAQDIFDKIKSNQNVSFFYRLNEQPPLYRAKVDDIKNSNISYLLFFDGEFEKE